MKKKVAILGATGYTGLELIRILINHPSLEIHFLGSTRYNGKKLKEVFPFLEGYSIGNLILKSYEALPKEIDIVFLALPHEVSMEKAKELIEEGFKVIDLSGAYRFADILSFKKFYGFEHKYPHLLEKAVYGLPEIFRSQIKKADLLANPGCYPTASLLALYPILKNAKGYLLDSNIIIQGLSGVSGAGRGLKQHFHFPEMTNNLFHYKVINHRHIPEMEYIAKLLTREDIKIRFTPTVVPIDRGMICTVYIKMKKIELMELFVETYRNEPFIKILREPPQTKWVNYTNFCLLYPVYDERTSTAVIISAIDNLIKGASGQAVQNANLILGLKETEGLDKFLPSIV